MPRRLPDSVEEVEVEEVEVEEEDFVRTLVVEEELECLEHGKRCSTLKWTMETGIYHCTMAARCKHLRLVSIEEEAA